MSDREDKVYKANLAEASERYDEMLESMKKVASLDVELTEEERNMLFVAFKKVAGAPRASLLTISSIQQEVSNEKLKLKIIREYRAKVEKELKEICSDVLLVLDKHLSPSATTLESKVYYLTMKGDCFRYLAEFSTGQNRKEAIDNSLKAYSLGTEIAILLSPSNPIRLGLALNFSVFHYDILKQIESAFFLLLETLQNSVDFYIMMPDDANKKYAAKSIKTIIENMLNWRSELDHI